MHTCTYYSSRVLKLPVEYLSFDNGIEDTYCHGIIDALLTRQFPARCVYKLDWANKVAKGSKERRDHGYKPDAIISRLGKDLAFIEIKPPKEEHCASSYFDMYLRHGYDIRKAAAVQIYGKV